MDEFDCDYMYNTAFLRLVTAKIRNTNDAEAENMMEEWMKIYVPKLAKRLIDRGDESACEVKLPKLEMNLEEKLPKIAHETINGIHDMMIDRVYEKLREHVIGLGYEVDDEN